MRIKTFKDRVLSYLVTLNPIYYADIEPTSRCNFKCINCLHNKNIPQGGAMNMDTFSQVTDWLKSIKTLQWISFVGLGEPYLNKNFQKMIEFVSESLGEMVKIHVVTNGSLLTSSAIEQLIKKVDKATFSVDAASKEMYSRVRPGGNWERLLHNIRSTIKFKRKGNARLETCLAYIINDLNIYEMKLFFKLSLSLGVDEVYFEVCNEPWGHKVNVAYLYNELFKFKKEVSNVNQLKITIKERKTDNLGCDYISDTIKFKWDGTLSLCPFIDYINSPFPGLLSDFWNKEHSQWVYRINKNPEKACQICNHYRGSITNIALIRILLKNSLRFNNLFHIGETISGIRDNI